MPRDVNGLYTLPAGNPVVTNTVVSSTWANTTLSDLATAMSNSLDRTGVASGMTGQFKALSGTIGTPGISFTAETTMGIYRAGAGDMRFAVLGVDILKFSGTALLPVTIQAGNGAIGAPAYSWLNDATAGWYRGAAGDFRFAIGGVDVAQILSTGLTARAFIPSAATVPNNGIYLPAANSLGFASNGTLRGSVNATGNWTLNAASGITINIQAGAGNEGLSILGPTSGTSSLAYMTFKDTNAVRLGYIGCPGIVHMAVESDNGNIRLITQAGFAPQATIDGGASFFDVGWRDALQNLQTANYQLVLSDRGRGVQFNGGGPFTCTIPANATVAFPQGANILIVNNTASAMTLAITTDALNLAGTATGGAGISRTIASNGIAHLYKYANTGWFVSGPGVT